MTPSESAMISTILVHARNKRWDKVSMMLESMLQGSDNPSQHYIICENGDFFRSGNKRTAWPSPGGFKTMLRYNAIRGSAISGSLNPKLRNATVHTPDGKETNIEQYLQELGMLEESFTSGRWGWANEEEEDYRKKGKYGVYMSIYRDGKYSEETFYEREKFWNNRHAIIAEYKNKLSD